MRRAGSSSQPRQAGLARTSALHGLWELAAEAELLDEGAVALEVLTLEVVQEPPPLADDLLLLFLRQGHAASSYSSPAAPQAPRANRTSTRGSRAVVGQ